MRKRQVCILITVKDDKENLKRCLLSLRNQTYKNFLLIIHDAFSSDGSYEIAKRFADKVIRKKATIPEGRNLLVEYALNLKPRFIGFVNSDVILPSNWLEESIKYILKKRCDAVGTFQKVPERLTERAVFFLLGQPYKDNPQKGNLPCEAVIIKREVLSKLKKKYGTFFQERVRAGEDPEFWSRVLKEGYKICYHPTLEIRHLQKISLLRFWRQQVIYGKGFADWKFVGYTHYSLKERVQNIVRSVINQIMSGGKIFILLPLVFFLLLKLLANLYGFHKGVGEWLASRKI